MMQRILQRQGAPDTPQNQNSVSQFAASNPDVLDRYGMNLPPGQDDNSALLKLALDKSIASTETPQQTAQVTAPSPNAARPQAATPAPGPRQPPMGPNPQTPNYPYPQPGVRPGTPATLPGVNPIDVKGAEAGGRGTPAPASGNYITDQAGRKWSTDDTGPGAGGNLNARVGQDTPGSGTFTANGPGGGSLMDWLIPAIGGAFGVGGAASAYRNRPQAPVAPPVQQPLALPAPPKQLSAPQAPQAPPIAMPDQSGPGGKPQQSAEEVARLKAEVAAENEQGARALQEQLRKQNAQRETGDLVKRAGRAVGRK